MSPRPSAASMHPLTLALTLAHALVAGSACVAPADEPAAPVLADVVTPTSVAVQTVRGTKQAATGIELVVLAGAVEQRVQVPLDAATQWAIDVPLAAGANEVVAFAVDGAGRTSAPATAVIVLDTDAPAAPDLDPVPAQTLLERVTISGTHDAGDGIVVNGGALPHDGTAFSFEQELDLGENRVRVASVDAAGNESVVAELVITRFDALPFTRDDLAQDVVNDPALTLTGTRGEGVEVIVGGAVAAPAGDPAGAWSSAPLGLAEGDNDVVVTASFPGEPSSAVTQVVRIVLDTAPPALALSAPLPDDVVADEVVVAGTASDARLAEVAACFAPAADAATACAADADFAAALDVTDGVFSLAFDAAPLPLDDGQLGAVVVRARDDAGNEARVTETFLVFRAPFVVASAVDGGVAGVAAPVALDLARPHGATGVDADLISAALVLADGDGAAALVLDDAGREAGAAAAGFQPLAAQLVDGGGASPGAGASAPKVAMQDGVVHMAWLEGGDLVYARAVDGVVVSTVTAVDGSVDPVVSADVSWDEAGAAGGALVAYAQGGEVRTATVTPDGSGLVVGTPGILSDAATLTDADGPTDVALAPGGAAVAWVEESDRDGAADDADVALVPRPGGTPAAPQLVSASAGGFIDGASAAPALAALANGDVAVVWLEDAARVVLARVGDAPLEVSDGAGVMAAPFIDAVESDAGDDVLVGWLDDGALTVRAGAIAALGAPRVVAGAPSAPAATAAAGFLAGAFAVVSWIEGGEALLFVVELL